MNKLAIFGVPRSGTSWLGQIFNSHPDVILRFQPLFSYGHKGRISEDSTEQDIKMFYEELVCSKDDFVLMKGADARKYPEFNKSKHPTHMLFKETRYINVVENILKSSNEIRVMGMIRNPLAVLASWIQAPKEFDTSWNFHNEWRYAQSKNQGRIEEYYGFEKWKIASINFLQFALKYPENFLLIRYDRLNNSTYEETKKIFQFCGLTIVRQVEEFLDSCQLEHDDDPYSVYRSRATDHNWENVLPYDVVKIIRSELKLSPLGEFFEDIL